MTFGFIRTKILAIGAIIFVVLISSTNWNLISDSNNYLTLLPSTIASNDNTLSTHDNGKEQQEVDIVPMKSVSSWVKHQNDDMMTKLNATATNTPKSSSSLKSSYNTTKLLRHSILSSGPHLEFHHLWSQYLHALIYPDGIPRQRRAINFIDPITHEQTSYDGYRYDPPGYDYYFKNKNTTKRKLRKRYHRFPSVQERIRFYMGRWYDAPRNARLLTDDFPHEIQHVMNITNNDQVIGKIFLSLRQRPYDELYSTPEYFYNYSCGPHAKGQSGNKVQYVRDMIDLAILHRDIADSRPVIIVHVGDGASKVTRELNRSYPVFGKVRDVIAERNAATTTIAGHHHPAAWRHPTSHNCQQCGEKISNIIWPLNRARHFGPASYVPKIDVLSWKEKKSVLVWRGRGYRQQTVLDNVLPVELSSWKQRYALAQLSLQHPHIINAKFTGKKSAVTPTSLIGSKLTTTQMLEYKYLIAIEGNDVSSGLKWMLFSQSLLFLPPVTFDSWAMESLLEPYVHYVPVNADMSDVLEKLTWATENDDKAREIAIRGSLWIYDLLFHPDAYREEEEVQVGMMRRYNELFGSIEEKKAVDGQ